jgi:hypothetical protein
MGDESERNCGNCGWLQPILDRLGYGECMWIFSNPTPIALDYHQRYMRDADGVTCQCWKPRQ